MKISTRNNRIYEAYKNGVSQTKLAKQYGISPARVSQIISAQRRESVILAVTAAAEARQHSPRPKQDPIFDFDWRTDGWLLLGFIIFAGVVALTVW